MTEDAIALGGLLFLGLMFSAAYLRWKQPLPRSPSLPPPLLSPVLDLLGRTPFDRRNPHEQRRIVQFLKRVDAATTEVPVHAKVNLLLAEMALVTGDREQAMQHFRAALGWDPELSVRRTLDRLESPSFLSRPTSRSA